MLSLVALCVSLMVCSVHADWADGHVGSDRPGPHYLALPSIPSALLATIGQTLTALDARQCHAACHAQSSCAVWTYNSETSDCLLKSQKNPWVSAPLHMVRTHGLLILLETTR
jgi:hypothetical protein